MKNHKKIKYTDGPIGPIKIVTDFLPPPQELLLKEESVKVTLLLSKTSVDYFKQLAKKNQGHYQKIIKMLLDQYASHYS